MFVRLQTLLKDEVRPQKVVVEPPFTYATRTKPNGRASGGANLLLGPTQNRSIGSQSRPTGLKNQMSLVTIESAIWDAKGKKKRQNSHTFGSRNNSMTSMLAANATRKSARTKRDVRRRIVVQIDGIVVSFASFRRRIICSAIRRWTIRWTRFSIIPMVHPSLRNHRSVFNDPFVKRRFPRWAISNVSPIRTNQ